MRNAEIPFHDLDDDEFFYIGKIEQSDPGYYNETHRHSFYELLWFTEVRAGEVQEIDFEEYVILPGQVYILSPNQVHFMEPSHKGGYMMTFSQDFFQRLRIPLSMLLKPYFLIETIEDATKVELEILIQLIEREFLSKKRKDLLEAYCTAFLIQVMDSQKIPLLALNDRNMQLLGLVEQNALYEKEVHFYAKTLNLSERRLNEISVHINGKTVKQLILDRVIVEAKRLISFGELSIKEIAYKIGYNDPGYFSRIFKNKVRLSPEEFREMYKLRQLK